MLASSERGAFLKKVHSIKVRQGGWLPSRLPQMSGATGTGTCRAHSLAQQLLLDAAWEGASGQSALLIQPACT